MRPFDIPTGRPTPPAGGPPRAARRPGTAAAKPLFLDFDPVLPWWPPAGAGRHDTHHRPPDAEGRPSTPWSESSAGPDGSNPSRSPRPS